MTNLKFLAGVALVTLSLTGCGSDNNQPIPPDEAPANPSLPTNGQVSADQLKNSAVLIDGYEQITVASDSTLTLLLESGEAFIRQLAWRDWYAHLLLASPEIIDSPANPIYKNIKQ